MYELKKKFEMYLQANLLGPGPRLKKKKLPACGLTKVEKHCSKRPTLRPLADICEKKTAKIMIGKYSIPN